MANHTRSPYQTLARSLLGRGPWFARFHPAILDRFVDEGSLVSLDRGEALFRRGDPVDAIGIVIEGSFEVSLTTASGKRHIAACHEAGQILNLIPVLDGQPTIHDGCARDPARVLLVAKQLFLDAVDRDPALVRSMAQVLCRRSRMLYESMSDSALLPLRARCARMLLTLMSAHGQPGERGTALSLKLSQDDFADMLGRTRQGVNRELKQLEREGAIAMTYSHFIILDEQALSAIVAG